jgi:hypothetical protein
MARFVLEITSLGNAAFEADAREYEVARVLEVAAEKIRLGVDAAPLYDVNGNRVGNYAFKVR